MAEGDPVIGAGAKRKKGARPQASAPRANPSSKPDKNQNIKDSQSPTKKIKTPTKPKTNAPNGSKDSEAPSPKKAKKSPSITSDHEDGLSDNEGNQAGTIAKVEAWSTEDIKILLDRMEENLDPADTVRYNTGAERLKWDQVAFGEYTAAQCKEQWTKYVITKVRRFRTLTEVVKDCKIWVKTPWQQYGKKNKAHPDMPKKPLTPYFRYFMDKRKKMQRKHPGMSVTDISKSLAMKFRNMSQSKKQKYYERYNEEVAEYRVALEKFKMDHPDPEIDPELLEQTLSSATPMKKGRQKKDAPPKTTSAQAIYIHSKIEVHLRRDPQIPRKDLHDLYRQKWSEITDHKKLKYIKKAIEAKTKFDNDVLEYAKAHADYEPRIVKTFLSKAEQRIKDSYDGKPEKPPANGYGMFSTQLLPRLIDIKNTERMNEVSRRWKELDQEDRDAYNLEASQKQSEYKLLYQDYLDKLAPDERERVILEDGGKKAAKVLEEKQLAAIHHQQQIASMASEKTKQPISALFFYIKEKRVKTQSKYPKMNHQELTQLLAKEFNNLSEERKAKYKRMEEDQKLKISEKEALTMKDAIKAMSFDFPGEPAKPPSSGYGLYSTEQLAALINIPSKERLSHISKCWKSMSEKKKGDYKKRQQVLMKKYQKELEVFKAGLSPVDLKRYEEYEEYKKKGLINKKKKKVKRVKKEKTVNVSVKYENEDDFEDDNEDESSEAEDSDDSDYGGTSHISLNQNGPSPSEAADVSSDEEVDEDTTDEEDYEDSQQNDSD